MKLGVVVTGGPKGAGAGRQAGSLAAHSPSPPRAAKTFAGPTYLRRGAEPNVWAAASRELLTRARPGGPRLLQPHSYKLAHLHRARQSCAEQIIIIVVVVIATAS